MGVVARVLEPMIFCGYFFGPKSVTEPDLQSVRGYSARDAVYISRVSALGVKSGKWSLIGKLADWDRELWPMPAFVRYEELTGRSYKVIYDENRLSIPPREMLVSAGIDEQAPAAGLAGSGFVEIRLDKLLK